MQISNCKGYSSGTERSVRCGGLLGVLEVVTSSNAAELPTSWHVDDGTFQTVIVQTWQSQEMRSTKPLSSLVESLVRNWGSYESSVPLSNMSEF